jgi:hypothetical protein
MKGTKIPLGNGCAVSFFSSFLFLFLFCLENISRTIGWGRQGLKLIKKFPKREIAGVEDGGNSSSSSSILVIM